MWTGRARLGPCRILLARWNHAVCTNILSSNLLKRKLNNIQMKTFIFILEIGLKHNLVRRALWSDFHSISCSICLIEKGRAPPPPPPPSVCLRLKSLLMLRSWCQFLGGFGRIWFLEFLSSYKSPQTPALPKLDKLQAPFLFQAPVSVWRTFVNVGQCSDVVSR